MSFFELLESSPKIFGLIGLALLLGTLIAFIFKLSLKYRLTGATIFAFLLSISSWAFLQSYSEKVKVDGALYLPIVYDNGYDLIVAKAEIDFPTDSIKPTLEQLEINLKKGSRNGKKVKIRIRGLEKITEDVSKPVIIGETEKSFISQLNANG